jgi:plasmid replication initiation protein
MEIIKLNKLSSLLYPRATFYSPQAVTSRNTLSVFTSLHEQPSPRPFQDFLCYAHINSRLQGTPLNPSIKNYTHVESNKETQGKAEA